MAKLRQNLAILLLFFASCAKASCPRGCRCVDEPEAAVDCSHGQLGTVPIFLNPRIKSLTLRGNRISSVSLDELSIYSRLETLDLSHNEMYSLEKGAFYRLSKLKVLNLSGNKIESLPVETFLGLYNLKILDLSNNSLVRLSTSVFADLRRLELLNTSSNAISTMSPGALTGLDRLVELHLDRNRLTRIPLEALESTVSLKLLNMGSNRLSKLGDLSFSKLNSLQWLNLEENELKSVENEAFLGLENLKKLDLRRNLLERLPTLGFRHLTDLETLEIGQNMFQVLPTSGFEGLGKLRQLVVSNCGQLKSVSLNAFSGLGSLETLLLSDNPSLGKIDGHAFESSASLRQLILSNNKLESLPKNLVGWHRLDHLDLRYNPWKCDCSTRWLGSAVRAVYGSRAGRAAGPICASPIKLRGRAVVKLQESDFNCPKSTQSFVILGLALVICGLVLMSVFLLLACHFRDRLGVCPVEGSASKASSVPFYEGDHLGSTLSQRNLNSRRNLLLYQTYTRAKCEFDCDYDSPSDFSASLGPPSLGEPPSRGPPSSLDTSLSSGKLLPNQSFRVITKYPVPITEL